MTCDLCKGRKVVYTPKDGGGFSARRCECVDRAAATRAAAEAGIVGVLAECPLDRLRKVIPSTIADLIEKAAKPSRAQRFAMFYGPPTEARYTAAVAYAFRYGSDRGEATLKVRLSELIDAKFSDDRGRAIRARIKSAVSLVVDLDLRTGHKLAPEVLTELYSFRMARTGRTIFTAPSDPRPLTGAYGPEFCARLGEMPWSAVTPRNRKEQPQ